MQQQQRWPIPPVTWRPIVLLIALLLAAACVFLAARGPLRSLASVVVLLGPGLGLAPLLQVRDRAVAALLVASISVTCLVCVTQAVTYIASFAWRPCAVILILIATGGTVAQILRSLAVRAQ